ncbi:MAG: hypothetical protein ACLGI8_05485 [Acidimicrobiia bacterium]|jgi:hypothetical protein
MKQQAKHPRSAAEAVDRRQFLRRAAVVGAGVWAVPTIISIDPAGAQAVTSPPPEPPVEVGGVTVRPSPTPGPAVGSAQGGTQVQGRTVLARTGAEVDDLLVAGLACTAGGAALLLWSAEHDT